MNWKVPTIAGIQRMTVAVTLLGASAVFVLISPRAALGFIAGAFFMIANLYLLVIVAKAIIGLAQGGGAAKLGVMLAPLKLFLFIGAAYLLIAHVRIDLLGFALGSLTQFAAIFAETARVSMRGAVINSQEQRLEAR